MRFLTRRTQYDPTVNYELIDHAPLEEQAKPVKWETDRTPESLYIRINEISTLYTRGKYTKGLAVQRLLDLLYDINQLHDEDRLVIGSTDNDAIKIVCSLGVQD